MHNLSQVRPGITLREYAERCGQPDPEFYANRYVLSLHGAGMADEYPLVPYLARYMGDGVLAYFGYPRAR
jgi:Xaa-Pro dipeptidase